MDKLVIVLKGGIVHSVYGPCPYRFDLEVIDLDQTDTDALEAAESRLNAVQQHLCEMY